MLRSGIMGLAAGARSPLTRRIVGINMIALGALVCGILYLTRFEDALIRERTTAILTEAQLIASTLSAPKWIEHSDLHELANREAGQFVLISKSHLQVYDADGHPLVDTSRGHVDPDGSGGFAGRMLGVSRSGVLGVLQHFLTAPSDAPGTPGPEGDLPKDDQHIKDALAGHSGVYNLVDGANHTIIASTIPVIRDGRVVGAVRVATRRGDIDTLIRHERIRVFQVAAVTAVISILLSLVLANTIALPLRRMAEAAECSQRRPSGYLDPATAGIPDLTYRRDEIGYLSGAMRSMAETLFERVAATEHFAADVAHEIRNPLTSLRSAVETLRMTQDRPETRGRLLDVIEADVIRLDRLVTDISNSSRLDSEMVRERRASFSVTGLIQTLVELQTPAAEDRRAALFADLPHDAMMVRGIESRLAQVFINLITNALSFLPPGGAVVVTARTEPSGDIRVSVRDTGPGLPQENLDDIFRRFYSERPEHDFGGHSGLGLSISRQIVDAHGGRIWAENRTPSPPGAPGGACFHVVLPR